MRKQHSSNLIFPIALSCAFSAACSSGGGGGMSPVVSAGTSVSTMTTPVSDLSDTGIAGSVGTPVSASFGSAPAQLATQGGATFDNSSGSYPKNVTFPMIFTALQKSSTGLSAVPGDQGATATVTSTVLSRAKRFLA